MHLVCLVRALFALSALKAQERLEMSVLKCLLHTAEPYQDDVHVHVRFCSNGLSLQRPEIIPRPDAEEQGCFSIFFCP